MDSAHSLRPRLSLPQARQRTNGPAEPTPLLVSGSRHYPRRPSRLFLRTLDRRKSPQSDPHRLRHDRHRSAHVVCRILRPPHPPHRTNFARRFPSHWHIAGPGAFSRRLALRHHYHYGPIPRHDARSRRPLLLPSLHSTDRRSRRQRSPQAPETPSRRRPRHPAIHPDRQHRRLRRSRLHRHRLLPAVFADTHSENLYLLPYRLWYSHFVARVPPPGFCALAPAHSRFSTRRPSPICAQSLPFSLRTPHSGILRRPIAATPRASVV